MTHFHTQVIVVGAGHAGCEAALAAARCGAETILLTIDLDTIAAMPCNPSIGGQGKAQLVREIDALGGAMGELADTTQILARMLNTRKGLAVQCLRVQSDKQAYHRAMRARIMATPRLTVLQAMVDELLIEGGQTAGVRTRAGETWRAPTVILAPGTFLQGRIHLGDTSFPAGRAGEPPAEELSRSLATLGLPLLRLKTGTPPRIMTSSANLTGLERQDQDPDPPKFSLFSENSRLPRRPCFITRTNEQTHAVIRAHFHQSALIAGRIKGTGARYCPSIEDKIRKFPEKNTHKVFIEPESADNLELYLQGLSSSLPEQVQEIYLRTIAGLEEACITRPGYGIEYDVVDPTHILPSLMTRAVPGLFLAGQINGTSGYEEAAAQGVLAGINATAYLRQEAPLILSPDESYLGLMIQEITTIGIREPYRVFTSRAPLRLHLRMTNAEERLSEIAAARGALPPTRIAYLHKRQEKIADVIAQLAELRLDTPDPTTPFTSTANADNFTDSAKMSRKIPATQLLKRPGTTLKHFLPYLPVLENLDRLAADEIEVRSKYEGYLRQELQELQLREQYRALPIPGHFFADLPTALSFEARQNILAGRPTSIGELMKLPGLRASDVALVLMSLRRAERTAKTSQARQNL